MPRCVLLVVLALLVSTGYTSTGHSNTLPEPPAPRWLDNGKLSARAESAIALLQDAAADGLNPADYDVASLLQLRDALAAGTPHGELPGDFDIHAPASGAFNSTPAPHGFDNSTSDNSAFDNRLTELLSRYVHDIWLGRVDPATLDYAYGLSAKRAALPARLQDVLTAEDPATAARALQPALPLYAQLRTLLARYRVLAAQYPDSPALPSLPGKKLEPGTPWAGTGALLQWLAVLGDAKANVVAGDTYDDAAAKAVKHFQSRHGLDADGVIGAQTYAALLTPLPQRVLQITLAMERLRWLDATLPNKRFIMVNVPQFTLWAYAPQAPAESETQAPLRMPVVVGQAGKTETPLFAQSMTEVTFNPYWNVPSSITLKELLPKLQKDPDYLDKEEMERVGRDGKVYTGRFDHDARNSVIMGEQRIRQRPGAKNALGILQLSFPNAHDIYMHDTPAKSFFTRTRRDFSHGCIRVGNPVALALFALEGNGSWDDERIAGQVKTGTEKHTPLKVHPAVVLVYLTANLEPDGQAVFLPDIYGRDAALAAALAH